MACCDGLLTDDVLAQIERCLARWPGASSSRRPELLDEAHSVLFHLRSAETHTVGDIVDSHVLRIQSQWGEAMRTRLGFHLITVASMHRPLNTRETRLYGRIMSHYQVVAAEA